MLRNYQKMEVQSWEKVKDYQKALQANVTESSVSCPPLSMNLNNKDAIHLTAIPLPNLDITPKEGQHLMEHCQTQMSEQDESFRSHGDITNIGLETGKVDFRKYSIEEQGHLEREKNLSPNSNPGNLDYSSTRNSLNEFAREAILIPKINIKTTVDSPPSDMGKVIPGPNKKFSQSFIQPSSPQKRSSLTASPQPSPTNRKRNYSFREDDGKPQNALVTDVRQALKQEVMKVEKKKYR